MKKIFQKILPSSMQSFGAAIYWFGFKRKCPICGWTQREFRAMVDVDPNFMEWCSRCHSLARTRLIYFFLQRHTNLFQSKLRVLHFAAESSIQNKLKSCKNLEYLTADIERGYTPGQLEMDVQDIQFSDNSFDAVICIHVLEHVENDHKAIEEIYRVLKPGGWALLNSHYHHENETTYEDPSITEPAERLKHFNQADHYRVYGRDFGDRLSRPGFEVTVTDFLKEFTPEEIERYQINTTSQMFLCKKPG